MRFYFVLLSALMLSCEGAKFSFYPRTVSPLFVRYWATADVTVPSPKITKAVVVQHGMDLNADTYFENMMRAIGLAFPGGNSSIFVLSARHQQYDHNPEDGELFYDGEVWNMGGLSSAKLSPFGRISSFAVMDSIIETIVASFPNLSEIVFAGHSAGGQFSVRYAFSSRVNVPSGRVSIKFVVANPSTYPYLSAERPSPVAGVPFVIPDSTNCTDYNEWRYGLERVTEYVEQTGIANCLRQFRRRPVTYLLGDADTCNEDLDPTCDSHGLDRGCQAMFQGRWRFERGQFWKLFLTRFYGQNPHSFAVVPGVGHDNFLMFASPVGLKSLFF